MLPSDVRDFASDSRATIRSWAAYKRQTGRLPWLSIAIHFLNWFVIIVGLIFLIWCNQKYHWSQWQFGGVLVGIVLPYAFFWSWIKNKIQLNQIRDARRVARTKTLRGAHEPDHF